MDDHEQYRIVLGDCIENMGEMPEACMDFSVFSPPFPSLYAYTDSEADIGNVDTVGPETRLHFGWFFRALRRVVKPGRVIVVHCMQIPSMKRTGGIGGLIDFRGLLIRLAQRAGLVWEYEWIVRKNPQAQAIRTRSRELQFAGLESDRAKSRGCLPDHLLKFRVPGENETPVESKGDVSREDWIQWAETAWFDIRETETLNLQGTKGDGDTKHICPLQLEVIRRLILLFTNRGEVVFTPFAGIGSEVVTAIRCDRRGYGCELKPEYHAKAIENCEIALASKVDQMALFTA